MEKPKSIWVVPLLGLLLSVITVATFWPALHHDFINFDDPDYVVENGWVRDGLTWNGVKWAFTTGHASNWHPVTWLSHMLDAQWFGMKPMGHHATNLFFHTVNSVLLLLLLFQMTGAIWRSALAAALFALHPLHVESVAWVAERKDVLSTFFGLLCLMAYAKYVQTKTLDTSPGAINDSVSRTSSGLRPVDSPAPAGSALRASASGGFLSPIPNGLKSPQSGEGTLPDRGGEGAHRRASIWYGVAFLLLALGLMSKPMLVTWPFVMLLLDVWPLNRIERSTSNIQLPTLKRLALEKLPFLALVVGSCIVTVLVQAKGGAVTTAMNLPLADRLENAGASYVKYLAKTLWPSDLAIFYPHPETRFPISEQWPWWGIALAAVTLVGILVLALRRLTGQPYLAIGWFWYSGTLIPVIGIVQVGTQAMADRYTYVPLIGIFIAAVWGVSELVAKFTLSKSLVGLTATAVVVGFACVSRNQLAHWQDSFSIFQRALAVTHHNAPAHGNLGTEYVKRGDVDQGIKHFKAALESDPHFADAAYSLGLAEQNRGNLEAAAAYYRDALERRADHINSHHNLGAVLWLQGQTKEAETQFRETLQLKPDHLEAHENLGNLLLELRRPSECEPHLSTVLLQKPRHTAARVGLGLAYKMKGQWAEAEVQFRQVLTDQTNNLEAALNLGVVLTELGRTNHAAAYLEQVIKAKPHLPEELTVSARNLSAHGKVEAASDLLTAVVVLKPDNVPAIEMLAQCQAQAGQLDLAKANYERALARSPSPEAYYYLGVIRGLQGDAKGMVTNLNQAIQLKPDYLAALNELAWILATHPNEKIRNGREAVTMAERACTIVGDKEARYWGTLDAAYAEAGRFEEAIKTAEKARSLAMAAGQTEIAEAAASRQSLYRENKSYRP